MMPNDDELLNNFRVQLQEHTDNINSAILEIRNDALPDVVTLENQVNMLCEEILAAHEDIIRPLRPVMAEMITSLETLIREIESYQERAHKAAQGV